MTKRYKKRHSPTPSWVDTLITWLEFIGMIASILATVYALITWVF